MIKRPASKLKALINKRSINYYQRRVTSRKVMCETKKRTKIRMTTSVKCFLSKRKNFILNSSFNSESMEILTDRCDVMKFGKFDDDTSTGIKNELQAISLSCRKIQKKTIAVVKLRMNEGGSNSTSS